MLLTPMKRCAALICAYSYSVRLPTLRPPALPPSCSAVRDLPPTSTPPGCTFVIDGLHASFLRLNRRRGATSALHRGRGGETATN